MWIAEYPRFLEYILAILERSHVDASLCNAVVVPFSRTATSRVQVLLLAYGKFPVFLPRGSAYRREAGGGATLPFLHPNVR